MTIVVQQVSSSQYNKHVNIGEWRNMEVAIKSVLLEGDPHDSATSAVAREAAIACNLSHPNIVATYTHDVACLGHGNGTGAWPSTGPDAFRFYLIQVCDMSQTKTKRTSQFCVS